MQGFNDSVGSEVVLGKAVLRAAEQLHLSRSQLASVLDMDVLAITKLQNQPELDPNSKQGKLALLLIRLAELEALDAFCNWRDEKGCQMGKYWNICTHQFRRSLAVYGASLGIIGLGALSVQFKHLTESMTLYYRNNAVFAPNILVSDSQKEFIQELEYQRLVHSYAQFDSGVINSSSRLLGGAGTYLQLQKDREQLLKVFPDRDEIIKRMKKGEIAYKPSLFGACTNPDSCEKISFTVITSCLSCTHAIFDTASIDKMQKAVQRLQSMRDTQAQSSLLYGQMDSDIMALNKMIKKLK